MSRPVSNLRVHGAQDRRSDPRIKLPWVARWTVDGTRRSRSFRTKSEADRFLALLVGAAQIGERFDASTGEPTSWSEPAPSPGPIADDSVSVPSVYDWTQRWLGQQWGEWQPRTRQTAIEGLVRFVMLAIDVPGLDRRRATELRLYLKVALRPDRAVVHRTWDEWIRRHSLRLVSLDRETVARIDRDLGVRLDGRPSAATTSNRTRIIARQLRRSSLSVIRGQRAPATGQGERSHGDEWSTCGVCRLPP
jgi:hypothetical protein